jgi:hypothetical protein
LYRKIIFHSLGIFGQKNRSNCDVACPIAVFSVLTGHDANLHFNVHKATIPIHYIAFRMGFQVLIFSQKRQDEGREEGEKDCDSMSELKRNLAGYGEILPSTLSSLLLLL